MNWAGECVWSTLQNEAHDTTSSNDTTLEIVLLCCCDAVVVLYFFVFFFAIDTRCTLSDGKHNFEKKNIIIASPRQIWMMDDGWRETRACQSFENEKMINGRLWIVAYVYKLYSRVLNKNNTRYDHTSSLHANTDKTNSSTLWAAYTKPILLCHYDSR